jgi:hypothetical protein
VEAPKGVVRIRVLSATGGLAGFLPTARRRKEERGSLHGSSLFASKESVFRGFAVSSISYVKRRMLH